MSHPESAIADLYDHKLEQAPSGRRRRTAPDWGGDDLFTTAPRRRRFERGAHHAGERSSLLLIETAEHPVQRRVVAARAEAAADRREQRRTVTVTGHPGAIAARRRPAPTMDQRLVGSRPERIASYAVCLGFLLVLIAFLSAGL